VDFLHIGAVTAFGWFTIYATAAACDIDTELETDNCAHSYSDG